MDAHLYPNDPANQQTAYREVRNLTTEGGANEIGERAFFSNHGYMVRDRAAADFHLDGLPNAEKDYYIDRFREFLESNDTERVRFENEEAATNAAIDDSD